MSESSDRAPTVVTDPAQTVGTGYSRNPSGADRRDARLKLDRGNALGRYLIVDLLGAGAMGQVFRAYDPDLDRSIAIKLVGFDGADNERHERERARLLREAQAMARLSHPNVIPVFDVGVLSGRLYVAMELVEGSTLKTWQRAKTRTWKELLVVYLQAGEGLAAAHRAGLIHRDFKPDNVMVDELGRARVLDFGLARAVEKLDSDETLEQLRSGDGPSLDQSMTNAGAVVGTPAYMSAEQHFGQACSAKSDQFSFCVALFEAVVGHRPFEGDNRAALAYAITQEDIQAPTSGDVPTLLLRALEQGLRADPDARHASMDVLLAKLRGIARPRSQRWSTWIPVAAVGVGAAAWALQGEAPPSEVCLGAKEQAAAVWNPQRRLETGQPFEGSALVYAPEVWAQTEAAIDAHVDAWTLGRTEACRATRVTGEQSEAVLDRKMLCFDDQLRRIDALVAAMATLEDAEIRYATDAALALPSASICGDSARFVDDRRLDPPDVAAAVAELQAPLERVRADAALGRYSDARKPAADLAQRAAETASPRFSALALEQLADIENAVGDPKAAAGSLEHARDAAIEAGDDELAAELSQQLGFTRGSRLAQFDEGQRDLRLADAFAARLGAPKALIADIASARGAVFVTGGQYQAGIDEHTKALAYWQTVETGRSRVADVLHDIGSAHRAFGNSKEAVDLHRRGMELRIELYGDHHPLTANSQRELGNALSGAERFDEAKVVFDKALATQRDGRGDDSTFVAILLDDLGRVHRAAGELEAAIAKHREALVIWEKRLGGPHPDIVVSVLNIGYTLSAAGKFEDALVEFTKAKQVATEAVGDQHPYIVYTSNAAASALVDLDRFDEAWDWVRPVLELRDIEVDPTLLAETKFIGANALWGTPDAAGPTRTRARRLAHEAKVDYAADAKRWAVQIAQIETWLEEHPEAL